MEALIRRAPTDWNDIAPEPLSPRETEVAALVALGLTNRQIAERLAISPRTAEVHVARSLDKLGLGSRSRLAVWAVRTGLAVE